MCRRIRDGLAAPLTPRSSELFHVIVILLLLLLLLNARDEFSNFRTLHVHVSGCGKRTRKDQRDVFDSHSVLYVTVCVSKVLHYAYAKNNRYDAGCVVRAMCLYDIACACAHREYEVQTRLRPTGYCSL